MLSVVLSLLIAYLVTCYLAGLYLALRLLFRKRLRRVVLTPIVNCLARLRAETPASLKSKTA